MIRCLVCCIYIYIYMIYNLHRRPKLTLLHLFKDKDKDSFIGPQEFIVGYSKAPEQPQSSTRPICHSHAMTSTGREPATIRIAAYRSSPCYALRHGRRRYIYIYVLKKSP